MMRVNDCLTMRCPLRICIDEPGQSNELLGLVSVKRSTELMMLDSLTVFFVDHFFRRLTFVAELLNLMLIETILH